MNHLLRNTTPALPTGTTGYGAGKRFQFSVNIHLDFLLVTDSECRIPLYNAASSQSSTIYHHTSIRRSSNIGTDHIGWIIFGITTRTGRITETVMRQ